jgi:truncated hemoglobin YjbI
MVAQISKQQKFMAFAFGGPAEYKGKSMLEAHRGMNLTDEHFGAIAEHLFLRYKSLMFQRMFRRKWWRQWPALEMALSVTS